MEAARDWSSLPADLVNRVAGCIIASNDLDYYMDLRAVCHHWRSCTVDPNTNHHDDRFRPTRWLVLNDAAAAARSDTLLFVNTVTGRFLRKSLPPLDRYEMHFVTTTSGGLIILADWRSPFAARVLNPFTGSLTRFTAAMPCESLIAADVVGSPPILVLACDRARKVYWADTDSLRFHVDSSSYARPASMLALAGWRCAAGRAHGLVEAHTDAEPLARDIISTGAPAQTALASLLVELDAQKVMLIYDPLCVEAFWMDSRGKVTGMVRSIGNHALFFGQRCLSVDAAKFPSVEANCIYYAKPTGGGSGYDIFKYKLSTDTEERLYGAASFLNSSTSYSSSTSDVLRPYTIVQLLTRYTMDIPYSELMLELELYFYMICTY
jgi:hypothetical protein